MVKSEEKIAQRSKSLLCAPVQKERMPNPANNRQTIVRTTVYIEKVKMLDYGEMMV